MQASPTTTNIMFEIQAGSVSQNRKHRIIAIDYACVCEIHRNKTLSFPLSSHSSSQFSLFLLDIQTTSSLFLSLCWLMLLHSCQILVLSSYLTKYFFAERKMLQQRLRPKSEQKLLPGISSIKCKMLVK